MHGFQHFTGVIHITLISRSSNTDSWGISGSSQTDTLGCFLSQVTYFTEVLFPVNKLGIKPQYLTLA